MTKLRAVLRSDLEAKGAPPRMLVVLFDPVGPLYRRGAFGRQPSATLAAERRRQYIPRVSTAAKLTLAGVDVVRLAELTLTAGEMRTVCELMEALGSKGYDAFGVDLARAYAAIFNPESATLKPPRKRATLPPLTTLRNSPKQLARDAELRRQVAAKNSLRKEH